MSKTPTFWTAAALVRGVRRSGGRADPIDEHVKALVAQAMQQAGQTAGAQTRRRSRTGGPDRDAVGRQCGRARC